MCFPISEPLLLFGLHCGHVRLTAILRGKQVGTHIRSLLAFAGSAQIEEQKYACCGNRKTSLSICLQPVFGIFIYLHAVVWFWLHLLNPIWESTISCHFLSFVSASLHLSLSLKSCNINQAIAFPRILSSPASLLPVLLSLGKLTLHWCKINKLFHKTLDSPAWCQLFWMKV